MTKNQLEQRVTALEQEVAELKMALSRHRQRDWRRTIGIFDGDEVMGEILGEALKVRERDRASVRRRDKQRRARVKA